MADAKNVNMKTVDYIFFNPEHTVKYSSYVNLFLLFNVYFLIIQCYFDLKRNLKCDNKEMDNDNQAAEEITNAKLFEAILDIKKNLNENTDSVSQIDTKLEAIRQQQNEIKKNFLSFRTNTQSSIRALETSQQKITESQQFISTEFRTCKSDLKATQERAKSAEAKVIKLTAELQSVQEKSL